MNCSGMLSKGRGQVLYLAAVLYMLCTLGTNQPTDDIVSEAAVKAAINYVQVVCQQAAYIAGRGSLEEEIQWFKGNMNALRLL